MSEALPAKGFGAYLFAGFGALDGGVHNSANTTVKSELVPNGLDVNQCGAATNCSMRGGNVTHRTTFARRVLKFDNATDQANFERGLFQGAGFYEAQQSSLVVSIAGRLFQIRVEAGFEVKDISIAGDLNPSNLNLAWFVQLGPFLVVQDGSSKPLIFSGSSTRRATKDEIKPGTVMAVSQGRIWYATANGYSFRATDIVGNTATGHAQWQFIDSGLLETENDYLNEGGDFAVPPNSGGIRAMIVPNLLDTSLGQGPLQVFTSRGAFSVNAPVDRTQWKNVTYPIQTESQLEYGALGPRSTVNVNGDIFYRSLDGIRSFKLARADFQQWLNTPVSKEVEGYLSSDESEWLFWGSAVNWSNRLLMTCWPRQSGQGLVHDGLLALDFDLITSLRERAPAAWEGVWTGVSILQIIKGTFGDVSRAFVFVLALDGRIELWELVEATGDETANGDLNPVNWSFETPSYTFGRAESLKRLMMAAFWLEDIQGEVQFRLQFRPDRYPCWVDWYAWSECAPVRQCLAKDRTCKTLRNLKPQYRPKVKISQPPDTCNATVSALMRDGYEFAFRLQVVGHAVVKKARFGATDQGEKQFQDCQPVGACLPLDCCPADPAEYRIPGEGAPTGGTLPPGYPYPAYPGYPDAYPSQPPEPPPNPFPHLPAPSPGEDPTRPGPPEPPPLPPGEPEIPVVNGWTQAWTGEFDTNYWVEKTTNDPDADIPADLQAYLRALLANEWALNPPENWGERQLGWSFVDVVPQDGWYLDGAAKFAADPGHPMPAPGDPTRQFTAVWVLAFFWR